MTPVWGWVLFVFFVLYGTYWLPTFIVILLLSIAITAFMNMCDYRLNVFMVFLSLVLGILFLPLVAAILVTWCIFLSLID